MARVVGQVFQIFEAARVGQGIEVEYPNLRFRLQEVSNKIRADESCAARDQDVFH